jgi:hypothetical protein
MEKTPSGTSVGVDDPYAFAGRCDFLTGDGRCRFAVEHVASDPAFARERRREDYACPVVDADLQSSESAAHLGRNAGDNSDDGLAPAPPSASNSASNEEREGTWMWRDCPHYRSRSRGKRCVRCGLEERRTAGGERPLLDEHHLSYADSSASGPEVGGETRTEAGSGAEPNHEITVSLCRWCHAKVHGSWARIDDEASPDPEAIAAREGRLTRERAESAFETAADRRDRRDDGE